MNLTIRLASEQDYPELTKIHDMAFNQPNEGKLVEGLRQKSAFEPKLSLLAIVDNKIIGHLLLFPITINTEKTKHETLSLAPIGVDPAYQNQGVGSELIKECLKRAKSLGYKSVIVVGDNKYYRRFGFEPATKWGIKDPFGVSAENFLALELIEDGLKGVSGTAEYPEEFYEE